VWRRSSSTLAVVVLVVDGAEVARWSLCRSTRPDLALVDELARLHLAARRLGWTVQLCDVSPRLDELLGLVGLRATLTGNPRTA
jgi:hypothetical protein